MSDGPHKSLPMTQHWKTLAERAATQAYTRAEVVEALGPALIRDFCEAPLDRIRDILGRGTQYPLFVNDCASELEEVRRGCRGSAVDNTLIDCAIEASMDGLSGDHAFKVALGNAMCAHVRGNCHSIEEHYLRMSGSSVASIHARLDMACSDFSFDKVIELFMADGRPRMSDLRLRKRTGVDEGPSLGVQK